MLRHLLYFLALVVIALSLMQCKKHYASDETTIASGKELFTKYCASCHSLEQDGMGPPLGGITNLLSEEALIDFIKNPSHAIEAGEQRAVALKARYKQVMPAYDWLQDNEISAILSYIHQQTKLHNFEPLSLNDSTTGGLTGRLVKPVKKSDVRIELEEVVQIPRIPNTSPDLGIVTLRAHPSGDGTFFVSDQCGVIYRVSNGKADVFLDVREHIKDFQCGPGIATGIGSFDFHPDFLNNGLIYITHAETFKGQKPDYSVYVDTLKSPVQWIIGEWKMNNVKDKVFSGTHREMLRTHAPTFAHGCQDIQFIPGIDKSHPEYGLLYIQYGDGGANNIKHPELSHHLKSYLGTILRIDPAGNNSKNGKYGIPSDNPFINESDPDVVKEIYAFGFRNPHRLVWDPLNNNRLMSTDIGEANVEEINIIEKGGDYGWPAREGDFGINTIKDVKKVFKLSKGDLELFQRPFVQYDHEEGQAISAGFIYEGDKLGPLKNKLVLGDIVNGRLFYINIDPQLSDSSVYELAIQQNGKETNLQEMSQTKRLHLRVNYDRFNKELYVITKADGRIRRVSKAY
jgi:glucose/arabinose dehydrogenase/mono/diheme cytochrome c family protein